MIFHEIYSAYYNAVAKIITAILEQDGESKDLKRIVTEQAFGESALTILPALKSGRWQLMTPDRKTPIAHKPTMPLTTLELRWLKAIASDRRMRLFGFSMEGLEDVEPLFGEEDYYVYDRYADGDPYEDEGYVERFRIILEAIHKKLPIKVEMQNKNGQTVFKRCIPEKLEYSEKDDKFRVYTGGRRYGYVMNLSRITKCNFYKGEKAVPYSEGTPHTETVTLAIHDEKNALERVMLHFAHFEKRAECVGKREYRLTISYNRDDETEMVIRILSFGPHVRVVSPDSFVDLIKEKLKKQRSCGLK